MIILTHKNKLPNATAYAIDRLQDRGRFFIDINEEIYIGQVVGENSKDSDMGVNLIKGKQLTNMRKSGTDDGVVEANAHYADASGSHKMMGAASFKLEQGKFADAFHIFKLEWDETKIAWFVDGQQFASMPISTDELSEFREEFFILLNIAVGGKHAGRPDSTTTFPQLMYIDWIRVYKKKG